MKNLKDFISEKYERMLELPPFEAEMVMEALRYFLETKGYERDKDKGSYYTKEQVENTIKLIKNAKIKV